MILTGMGEYGNSCNCSDLIVLRVSGFEVELDVLS